MNTIQKRKILVEIQRTEQDLSELKKCRAEIARNGYASATMSSGGGSKSYTRMDVSKLTETICQLTKELQQLKTMLSTDGASRLRLNSILHIYS